MLVRARLRSDWLWWGAALLGVATMAWLGLAGFAWSDYDNEVSGAFQALIRGDVWGFLELAPAYGGSLVLRAPFAAVTAALGGGELAVFRAVSIPCLLAVALLAVVLVTRMGERGRSTGARALVLGLCVANPITLRALELGHPEELLCAALSIGAVLMASSRRTLLAAVLLGLAIATKAWAVLAIGPVLLALPGRRMFALVVAGAVTGAVLAPLMLAGSPAAYAHGASTTGTIFQPWQVFWLLGDAGHVIIGGDGMPKPGGYRLAPGWMSGLTHPLIALLVVPLSLLWLRLRGAAPRVAGEQLLALLALLLLLRCVLDPWNVVYYELPLLLALLSWEALCRPDRPPILTLATTAIVWVTFERAPAWLSPDMQCALFLAWSLPLVAWLAREALWPGDSVSARRGAPRAVVRFVTHHRPTATPAAPALGERFDRSASQR
ncbi:MAG: hypothetical protein QOF69_717 [Solirubrobacteraceae bacterium]|nr:hypothetical protein [Solirubrobacteraceae bacterium]